MPYDLMDKDEGYEPQDHPKFLKSDRRRSNPISHCRFSKRAWPTHPSHHAKEFHSWLPNTHHSVLRWNDEGGVDLEHDQHYPNHVKKGPRKHTAYS